MSTKTWTIPVVILVIALAARVQLALGTATIHQDGPGYLQEARQVHDLGIRAGWQAIGSRKLVATLYAPFASDRRSAESWAIALSITFGSLAVFPIMVMARQSVGRTVSVGTGLLYAVHPLFVDVQSEVMSEGIAHLFVLSALAMLATWVRRPSWSLLLGAAVASAFASLCRPDGIALFGIATLGLALLIVLDRRHWQTRLVGWCIFVLAGVVMLAAAAIASSPPGKSVLETAPELVRRYVPPAETPERPEGLKHLEHVQRHGRVLGSALYLGKNFIAAVPLLLVPFILVGLIWPSVDRRGTRWISFMALLFLLLISGLAFIWIYRSNSRYFSLPCLLLLPAAASGLIRLGQWMARRFENRWMPAGMWVIVLAVLLWPSLRNRRYEHLSERLAWESLADHDGQELRIIGSPWRRAAHYSGINVLNPYHQFGGEIKDEIIQHAREGKLDAILILDCAKDQKWLQVVLSEAELAWRGTEVRRFPEQPIPGVHAATLYLRPGLAGEKTPPSR